MIVEERVYSTIPGGVPQYVQLWNQFGREAQVDCLGAPLGVYTCDVGDLNSLTYLWRFESLEDRATRRARLLHDQRFSSFRAKVRNLLVQQHNRILIPVHEQHSTEGSGK